jgi:hypothetical protein
MAEGRQIYLRKREINELAGLVDSALVGCDDQINYLENEVLPYITAEDAKKMYGDDIEEQRSRKRLLNGIQRKLWYYA